MLSYFDRSSVHRHVTSTVSLKIISEIACSVIIKILQKQSLGGPLSSLFKYRYIKLVAMSASR